MKRFLSIVLVICLILIPSTYYAAVPSGIESMQLHGGYVKQDKTKWCWAASAENAIRWEMDPTRTQWDAVNYVKWWSLGSYPNESGTIYESKTAAEYISNFTETYIATQTAKSFSFLSEQVYNDHPVIVAAGYYSAGIRDGGHATLIIGWSKANGNNRIVYYDSLTDTYETCTYTAFCNGSYNGRQYDQTCCNAGS